MVIVGAQDARAKPPEPRMRCDGTLVEVGTLSLTVRSRCGPPDHVFTVAQLLTGPAAVVAGRSGYVRQDVERWTYLGDPGNRVQVVEIRGGRVTNIEVLDWRTAEGCTSRRIKPGVPLGIVVLSCGRPAQSDRTELMSPERTTSSTMHGDDLPRTEYWPPRLIVTDTLVYDPGPGSFLQIYTFENGVLKTIETGERSR